LVLLGIRVIVKTSLLWYFQSVHNRNNAAVNVEFFVVSGSPVDSPQLPLGSVHRPRRAGAGSTRPSPAPTPCRRGRRPARTEGRRGGPGRRAGTSGQLAAAGLEPRQPVLRGTLHGGRYHRCVTVSSSFNFRDTTV